MDASNVRTRIELNDGIYKLHQPNFDDEKWPQKEVGLRKWLKSFSTLNPRSFQKLIPVKGGTGKFWGVIFVVNGGCLGYRVTNFFLLLADAPSCASTLVDQLIGVSSEESVSINCRVSSRTFFPLFSSSTNWRIVIWWQPDWLAVRPGTLMKFHTRRPIIVYDSRKRNTKLAEPSGAPVIFLLLGISCHSLMAKLKSIPLSLLPRAKHCRHLGSQIDNFAAKPMSQSGPTKCFHQTFHWHNHWPSQLSLWAKWMGTI